MLFDEANTGLLVATEAADELLVFGYACKLFGDDEQASRVNRGATLIPWQGDKTLMIDRYVSLGMAVIGSGCYSSFCNTLSMASTLLLPGGGWPCFSDIPVSAASPQEASASVSSSGKGWLVRGGTVLRSKEGKTIRYLCPAASSHVLFALFGRLLA